MKNLALAAAALAALLSTAPAIPSAHAETTLCTEITSLPFTITVQGVYCLKQNLNVNLASGNAITINAGNVTIDFNGFRVNNQAAATNLAYGIFALDRKNITLRNGFIRGFNNGIYLDENAADASSSHLVEGMKIADSGVYGIYVEGDRSVVRDNRVLDSGGGPSSFAVGIALQRADDGLIFNNIVYGVSDPSFNYGIFAYLSLRVEIVGNTVKDVDGGGGTDMAIAIQNVVQALVADNRLLNNAAAGTGGIVDLNNSENIVCRDNEAGGFSATPYWGCDFSNGNRQSFN